MTPNHADQSKIKVKNKTNVSCVSKYFLHEIISKDSKISYSKLCSVYKPGTD